MINMDESRTNKRIFIWSDRKSGRNCKNHNFNIKEKFRNLGYEIYSDTTRIVSRIKFTSDIVNSLMANFVSEWQTLVSSESGKTGSGRNKLRTYRLFKSEYKPENYCKLLMPACHRAAFAKFRCGVAPIRIETGRFENIDVNQRLCHFCNVIEDEMHVMLECSAYNALRDVLFTKAVSLLPTFSDLNLREKMIFLFSHTDMIRLCAKTCFRILQTRNAYFYK